MTDSSEGDSELAAMAQVFKIMNEIKDREAQKRILDWVSLRLGFANSNVKKVVDKDAKIEFDGDTEVESPLREGTINTVVSKLQSDSCRKLLVASAAYILLYIGRDKFTRDELVSHAKEARVWKGSYGVQTSLNINRMCDAGELIEKSKNVYDLAPKLLKELEQKLAVV